MLDIGVVVHGPNIVDSGYGWMIIDFLGDYGDVSAKLGGTMGRVAVIDGFLEDVVDISEKLVPSDSLKFFFDQGKDIIFLLNYGKSKVTGQVFGYKVFNNYFSKVGDNDVPVVQIERPGEEDGSIIVWNGDVEGIVCDLVGEFDLNRVDPVEVYDDYFSGDLLDGSCERLIYGVSVGENIMVNGVVIGRALDSEVVLVAEDGVIVDIRGGEINRCGVEKLGRVDLDLVVVKTGLLRKGDVVARILDKGVGDSVFRVGFLDNAGVDVYGYSCCDLVVVVGDDTMLVSSDILYRFGVPIMGIVDGDLDKVVAHGVMLDDSVVFKVGVGWEDVVGLKVRDEIFGGGCVLEFDVGLGCGVDFVKSWVVEILNNMNCKYIIE